MSSPHGDMSHDSPVSWRASYARYVAGRGISTAGTNLVNVVMALAVLSIGGSGLAAGLVLACSVFAQTALLPVGGIMADRVSRRSLVIVGNVVLAAVQTITGLLLVTAHGAVDVWMFVLAALLTGAATASVQPAFQGLIVQIVPPAELQRANASLRLVLNLARIAVPGLGTLLGASYGFGQVLIVAGASFASCSVVLFWLRLSRLPRKSTPFWAGGKEGLQAFARRPWLWTYALAGTLTVPLWLAGYQLLGPMILSEQSGGARYWGWAVSAFSTGMVLGSLVALRWRPARLMLTAVLIQLLWPLPLSVLALAPHPPLLLASMLLSGVGLELAVVFFETTRQQQVPEHLIGRTAAITLMGESILIPVGYLLAGSVADQIGPATVTAGCAVGIALVLLLLLFVPSIRKLRAQEPAQPQAVAEAASA